MSQKESHVYDHRFKRRKGPRRRLAQRAWRASAARRRRGARRGALSRRSARRSSRARELDLDLAIGPARGHMKARVVEHPQHPVVLRQDDRGERVDLRCRARGREVGEQHRRDPMAVPRVGHREGDFCLPGGPPTYMPCPTTVPSEPRTAISDSPLPGAAAPARSRVQIDAGAEVSKPARVFRERGEECAQPRHILGRRAPHTHGRPVTKHDVGLVDNLLSRGDARHGCQR